MSHQPTRGTHLGKGRAGEVIGEGKVTASGRWWPNRDLSNWERRRNGFGRFLAPGENPHSAVEYGDYLLAREIEAETECKGEFLTREGEAKGIPGGAFFNGRRRPTERYRKYMSEELSGWFSRNGSNLTATAWMELTRPQPQEDWR